MGLRTSQSHTDLLLFAFAIPPPPPPTTKFMNWISSSLLSSYVLLPPCKLHEYHLTTLILEQGTIRTVARSGTTNCLEQTLVVNLEPPGHTQWA